MTKLGPPKAIPAAKLRALAEALERDHFVRFKSGAQIEYEDCTACEGTGQKAAVKRHSATIVNAKTCPVCHGEKVRLLVTRPAGGTARYSLDKELQAAYAMALTGPLPKPFHPSGGGAKFGDDPPW